LCGRINDISALQQRPAVDDADTAE